LIGGNITDAILLEQGVPQGDIISPQLFNLMVKILLIKITRSKNIRG
jgi:retron-type reverse transcriptase